MSELFSLNISGNLIEFNRPVVMGIINVTPDSFYAASRVKSESELSRTVETMLSDGADFIDIGACSTRPGSESADASMERERLMPALKAVRKISDSVIVSVDTFRSEIAREAVEVYGANIINDISGGELDGEMFATVERLKVPYILMHSRGCPNTMQSMCEYDNVVADVTRWLAERVRRLALAGVADVIVDPGFGFAKTLSQNYSLLSALPVMAEQLERPVLVGLSRKSMVTRPLDITPDQALAPTTALHLAALERGASIIRTHDVKEGVMAVKLFEMLNGNFSRL